MIFRNKLILGLMVFGVLQPGCANSARYPLRLYDLDERQLLDQATTVLVGRTLGAQWETARQEIRWSGQYGVSSVRLVKVRLSVEQVIRGTEDDKTEVTAYYWAPEVFTNGRALHLPMQGERAVHYLVTGQGQVRYVADVMRSTTPVWTGFHRQPPKAIGTGAEAKIAAVLLTPGEGMNVARFVTNLSTATGESLRLVGFVGALPFLKALADSPVWEVQWAACVETYRSGFIGHDGCIDKLAPEAVKHGREVELRNLQSQRTAAEQRFRHAFLSDPVRVAKDYAPLPATSGIADFLTMLAQHPDKKIAARAQEELRALPLRQ
ncbi:MAG: hypothetical protein IT161_09960 [Bryobacterales bacterium]|nr:hypothetical protein [Bryobacterales bacterium]